MAKDDYFVIVYQVLSYLYQCLKKGTDPEPKMLMHSSPLLHINEKYWAYIIKTLFDEGYLTGVDFLEMPGSLIPIPDNMEQCMITPKGIEYLCENSMMKKAVRFLKDAKDLIPISL